jgi:hydrogenase nickel incorporation protein HypA/HybF
MHELAICQSLLDQVEAIGRREQAASITSITLRIGPLSGVEPELLGDAFPIAAAGTIAEGALLLIENLPVRVRCTICNAKSDATPNRLLCASCGDFRTQLISGDELLLASLELERLANAG